MLSHVDGYMLMHNNGSNIDENSNSHSIADGPKTYKHTSHDNAIAAMIGVDQENADSDPSRKLDPLSWIRGDASSGFQTAPGSRIKGPFLFLGAVLLV